jgi:hypothetical protein
MSFVDGFYQVLWYYMSQIMERSKRKIDGDMSPIKTNCSLIMQKTTLFLGFAK